MYIWMLLDLAGMCNKTVAHTLGTRKMSVLMTCKVKEYIHMLKLCGLRLLYI